MKKAIALILSLIMLTLGASAHGKIVIRLNGEEVPMGGLLVNGTTYVPFEAANGILSGGDAEIGGSLGRMYARDGGTEITAGLGERYTEASGRYFGSAENIEIGGRLYQPIRTLIRAYGGDIYWDAPTSSVDLYLEGSAGILSGEEFYDSEDLYWLARIISAEAGAEPMTGKILVGNVVMNRVAANQFPSSIYGVIFDTKHGVQFTPTINGTIYNAPTEESIIAAKICLDSYYISPSALYFFNPTLATSLWISQNRPYLMTVGGHEFYA